MAARILADFGAEVIKAEPPGKGDELRAWGTDGAGARGPYLRVVALTGAQ